MEDYVEEYKYSDCFWQKTKILYEHSDNKFKQFLSISKILKRYTSEIFDLLENFKKIDNIYEKPKEPNYSREDGIEAFFSIINVVKNEFNKLAKSLVKIANEIDKQKDVYNNQENSMNLCEKAYNEYKEHLKKLSLLKSSYVDSINKYVEVFLNIKYSKKGENSKLQHELENKLKIVEEKKKEYSDEIDNVEKLRLNYMELQGNIFAFKQEFEIECTQDLKKHIQSCVKIFEEFFKNFKISDKDKEAIENINGKKDTYNFAKENKSLVTGPKRNLYKEYSIDLNYYVENFKIVKAQLKNKNPNEQREIKKFIATEVTNLLEPIIKEELDELNQKVEEIAKDIKDNKLAQKDFDYLLERFQDNYDNLNKWKEESVQDHVYKKIGKEWDERFIYMHTFLKYFNKKRIENKELNEENFNYLCQAIIKILDLNNNEDIDYNLCDLVFRISSTFYTVNESNPNQKKYVNEVIRQAALMQKQEFWVGLTKFELNEEIQRQNKLEDTLKENIITEEKLSNIVIAKLMSISYNMMQFVLDSNLFNKILFEVFNFCKINKENRQLVVEMMDSQIKGSNINYLELNKEMLMSMDKKEE